jgi:hypothetical protein
LDTDITQPPFDPRPQLAHGRGGVAFRGPARQHNLNSAARLNGDSYAPSPV